MPVCQRCRDEGRVEQYPSMDELVEHLSRDHDVYSRATRDGGVRVDN